MRIIRSFVKRSGRITVSQQRALRYLYPKFGLNMEDGKQNLFEVFGNNNEIMLEIGFGSGENLIKLAQNNPNTNFIGVEVHTPGIGTLLLAIEKYNLTNIRIYQTDAIEVLKNCIENNLLRTVLLFFPDPWHKKRHNKRRIVQPDFVNLIAEKLIVGGKFYLATDWQNYADHMLDVLSNNELLVNSADNFIARPNFRPITKFEARGIKLGHKTWDLLFIKS